MFWTADVGEPSCVPGNHVFCDHILIPEGICDIEAFEKLDIGILSRFRWFIIAFESVIGL